MEHAQQYLLIFLIFHNVLSSLGTWLAVAGTEFNKVVVARSTQKCIIFNEISRCLDYEKMIVHAELMILYTTSFRDRASHWSTNK
ncbi:hypothetical protein BDQ17DRAFT_673134 [Cyathus striatus]|nr:hypothetical protein BDQ17DRAFT_673134 [Cyathus striatus]